MKFKSTSAFFDDEKKGLKNWTIRELPSPAVPDARFTVLRNWMRTKDYGNIEIVRAELPNDSFVRQVKHVTIWRIYCCITWRT